MYQFASKLLHISEHLSCLKKMQCFFFPVLYSSVVNLRLHLESYYVEINIIFSVFHLDCILYLLYDYSLLCMGLFFNRQVI